MISNVFTRKSHVAPFASLVAVALVGFSFTSRAQVGGSSPTAPAATLDAGESDETITLNVFAIDATKGQSYGASNMASATRMNTPIENVPQSISVVNANLLKDIDANSFDQAVRYTPGVTQRQNSPDGAVVRGLAAAFNHYQDGYFAPAVVTDMADVDRIEIIKGPSASIAGASESSGFVNFITKRPLFTEERSALVTIGSWNSIRGVLDLTGPVPGYQNMAYRVVGSYMNADSYRDLEHTKKSAVYPSFLWKITPNDELLVKVDAVSNTTPGNIGLAYLAPTFGATATPIVVPANAKIQLNRWAPININLSPSASMDRKTDLASVFLVYSHRFNDVLSVRQSANYYTFTNDLYRGTMADNFTYDSNGYLFGTYSLNRTIASQQAVRLQGDVALKTELFSDKLSIRGLAGYEVARTRNSNQAYASASSTLPYNLVAPVYDSGLPTDLLATTNSNSNGGSFATFANAQVGLFHDFAIITGGLRRDENKASWTRNNFTGGVTNTPTTPIIKSPLVGLTIKPFKWISLFAVYSDASAAANTVSTFPGISNTDPRQVLVSVTPDTTNREFGAKFTFFDGNLSVDVSHFDTTQNNISRNQTDPSFPGGSKNFIDSGNNSRGIEVAWAGEITSNLSIYGGYLHDQTSAPGTKPDGGQLELRGAPDDKIQLFARYQLGKSKAGAFAVKGGVVHQGSVYGRASDTYVIPGGTRIDLGIDYRTGTWSISTGIINVTNVIFPAFAVGQGSNTTDDPRNFYFTVEYKF